MKETIIKGTGNSRTLGSVPNLLTLYPTYEAFAAALAAGEVPIDLGALDPAGCQQVGDPLNKQTLLKDGTAAIYGELPDNPVPDDMFALIADKLYRLSTGMAKVTVTVKLSNGTPVPDACINNLKTITGGDVFTDQNGVAAGYCNAGNVTISLKNHLDITGNSKTISAIQRNSYTVELTATTRNFYSTTSSNSMYISGLRKTIDVSVCGGGAGGGGGLSSDYCGKGGGGGFASTKENVSFRTRTLYTASLGAGGVGGQYDAAHPGSNTAGAPGGTSSFLGVSASGGLEYENTNINATSVPYGNGSGGFGTNRNGSQQSSAGKNGTGIVFSSYTSTKVVGGGGGGGSFTDVRSIGGAPGGGAGGYGISTAISGSDGLDGVGGGGGGAGGRAGNSQGRKGGRGFISARIHFL